MAVPALPSEIRSLPIPDRVILVEQIWNSIAEDESAFELTDAQEQELDRRIAAHEASPDRGKSWEDIRRGLLGE